MNAEMIAIMENARVYVEERGGQLLDERDWLWSETGQPVRAKDCCLLGYDLWAETTEERQALFRPIERPGKLRGYGWVDEEGTLWIRSDMEMIKQDQA